MSCLKEDRLLDILLTGRKSVKVSRKLWRLSKCHRLSDNITRHDDFGLVLISDIILANGEILWEGFAMEIDVWRFLLWSDILRDDFFIRRGKIVVRIWRPIGSVHNGFSSQDLYLKLGLKFTKSLVI
jgi:hypothetical protein